MTPIRRLRLALIDLETALQHAGAELIAVEQTADTKGAKAELKETLQAFGIGGHQHRRREWLIEMGMLEQWHRGERANSTMDTGAAAHHLAHTTSNTAPEM